MRGSFPPRHRFDSPLPARRLELAFPTYRHETSPVCRHILCPELPHPRPGPRQRNSDAPPSPPALPGLPPSLVPASPFLASSSNRNGLEALRPASWHSDAKTGWTNESDLMPRVCSFGTPFRDVIERGGRAAGSREGHDTLVFLLMPRIRHIPSPSGSQSFLLVRVCLKAEVEAEVLRAARGTLPRWHLVPMELRPILGAGWVKVSRNTRALSQSLRRPVWEAARFSGWNNKRIEDADGPGLIIPGP